MAGPHVLDLDQDGVQILGPIIDPATLSAVKQSLADPTQTRNLRDDPDINGLIATVAAQIPQLIGLVCVQITVFDKRRDPNWFVPPHRDEHLPLGPGEAADATTDWKEGRPYHRADPDLLRRCRNLRLAIDDAEDGHLRVRPGSHRDGDEGSGWIPLPLEAGHGLIFVPTLIHASERLLRTPRRRALQAVFQPRIEAP